MKKSLLLVLGLMVGAAWLGAQELTASLRLVYADNLSKVNFVNVDGKMIPGKIGAEIGTGWRVKTGATAAELQLLPNGSKIRIAAETSLTVDSLQSLVKGKDGALNGASGTNAFSLSQGKVRMVAAKIIGGSYELRTPTAVGGVRGTDFARRFDPTQGKDWICVLEGKIAFASPDGKTAVDVTGGNFVDLAGGFKAEAADPAWLKTNFADLQFAK